jgi:hypothetical protein
MKIVEIANSARFRDVSPKQIVPTLADQGIYIASESSFYRVLKEQEMVKHRQPSKPASHNKPHEHVASGPCQVWSLGHHLPALTCAGHVLLPLHDCRCME